MSYGFTGKQLRQYRRAFEAFDEDGSGTIDEREAFIIVRRLGKNPTQDQVRRLIKAVDADGNGVLDYEEFLYLMKKLNDGELASAGLGSGWGSFFNTTIFPVKKTFDKKAFDIKQREREAERDGYKKLISKRTRRILDREQKRGTLRERREAEHLEKVKSNTVFR